jgi:hypothetical protein
VASQSARTRKRGVFIAATIMAAAASLGLSLFGALAWRAVTVNRANAATAAERFNIIRSRLSGSPPLVQRDASGRFVRRDRPTAPDAAPTRLKVLAYRPSADGLAEADVPFWFFKAKGPAVQLALRGTGFDLESLGLTAVDLERAGTGIVVDEIRDNGDRILAWTE